MFHQKLFIYVCFVLGLFGQSLICAEDTVPSEFLIVDVHDVHKIPDFKYGAHGVIPTYCVLVEFESDGHGIPRIFPELYDLIVASEAGQKLSQDQLTLLSKESDVIVSNRRAHGRVGYTRTYLLGVDRKNAELTAKAFLQVMADRAKTRKNEKVKEKINLQDTLNNEIKLLEQAEKEKSDILAKYNAILEEVYYSSMEQAREVVKQLTRRINEMSIDKDGAVASLKAANELEIKFNHNPVLQEIIYPEIVKTKILLASLEAKISSTSQLRQQAKSYLRLRNQFQTAKDKSTRIKNNIKHKKERLQEISEYLEKYQPSFNPPRLYGNKMEMMEVGFRHNGRVRRPVPK